MKKEILSLSILAIFTQAFAHEMDQALITQIQGQVRIFKNPSKTLQEGTMGQHVLFEGEYYLAENAKLGTKIEHGNIVQSLPGAKAKLVYPNGDQIYVSGGTSYRVFFPDSRSSVKIAASSAEDAESTRLNLSYGKLRGIIEKGGPRSRLLIKTKGVIMGVRGTDFFIAQSSTSMATEVSILRGSVSLIPTLASPPPPALSQASPIPPALAAHSPTPPMPIELKAGYSVDINPKIAGNMAQTPSVEVRKTTKEEFVGIQKSTAIEKKKDTPVADLPKEVIQAVASLEKKAVLVTLNDIKLDNPGLYQKLAQLPSAQVQSESLHEAAIDVLKETAPIAPPASKRKPHMSELDEFGASGDAYQKYLPI